MQRIRSDAVRHMQLKNGVMIAVVGLDSSGKTVVVDNLARWLERQVDVQQMHYGYARGTLVTSALRGALAVRRLAGGWRSSRPAADDSAPASVPASAHLSASASACPAAATSEQVPSEDHPTGWFASVRFLALAYERRRLLARAMQAASQGSIVIVERWYSLEAGKMDSPRLDPSAGNALKRLMARQEHRLYAASPDPDLIVHLQVNEAVAIERNRARTDVIDDTDAQIRLRFRLCSDLPYRCDTQVVIDNNGAIERTMEPIRHHAGLLLQRVAEDMIASEVAGGR